MIVDFKKLTSLLIFLFNKSNTFREQTWLLKRLKDLRHLKIKKKNSFENQTDKFLEKIQDPFQILLSDLEWISETIFLLQDDPTLATYEDKCVTKTQVRQNAPRIMAILHSLYEEDSQYSFQ